MGSMQGDRQQSVRDVTGTALDYNSDWSALFDQAGIASGDWNGRMLTWINLQLSTSYTEINGAMYAYAVSQGALNWSGMGTFTASGSAHAGSDFMLEDGTSFFLLEDGTSSLTLES